MHCVMCKQVENSYTCVLYKQVEKSYTSGAVTVGETALVLGYSTVEE